MTSSQLEELFTVYFETFRIVLNPFSITNETRLGQCKLFKIKGFLTQGS